ncbi:MAG: transglutaminase [Rhodospirillales bacterium 20-64-7]|nr:MAG: transglutaminase [Rhodospirillales bacterium 20-64-7]
MIYDIRHVTTYRYDGPVANARCMLRLVPRDGGGQRVLDSGLEIAPQPAEVLRRKDFFGNAVTSVLVGTSHRELRVAALARVEVNRDEPPAAGLTPDWEIVCRAALATPSLTALSPVHGLFPSRLVPLYAPATDYARQSFAPGRPVLEGAIDLMCRIKSDFRYDPEATAVWTPLAEAFAARGGVCQDFAHIMIAGLRGLGLPALYVSGYIRTVPPPGQPRLEGADASHAWVRVWCGPDFGWIELDPTNALLVGSDHVVLAFGRDYADVSPLDGVVMGSGGQTLSVSVDVAPVRI